jgi:hypothetical protein
MTIPPKHIDFTKDNLVRIVAVENNVEDGYEVEKMMDNDIDVDQYQSYLKCIFVFS